MPGRLVAKDITPDQESIDVPGQSLQAAALGALVVEYLRPVATLDKEEGCNDEKATPNRYRCAADGNISIGTNLLPGSIREPWPLPRLRRLACTANIFATGKMHTRRYRAGSS